ncbi:MAG: hypothetical protein ACOX32_00790 [Bacteroidaceae bacterium]|jgi:hypothetical protein|nr:hypothetical protein [Bacteroidaceae bacterium]MBP8603216.1 hypothetical protein [Bacteroidaceae bacterium]OPZ47909.1 MAG: hypothetical protein BWY95_01172 [Bacteroidetes bacterium ADurb.BinA104]HOD69302.1 hypothetical protein [Bacteroidaceae bacterium]HQL26800.1 hypothetical protein [Bacteroidaceae bacterium]
MRIRFYISLVIFFFITSVQSVAQVPDRTRNPVLQPGEGLVTSKTDIESMRVNKQDKRAKTVDVYMFALSFSPVDSVMYISDIEKIEQAVVRNKWFLEDRKLFEESFQDYVRARAGDLQLSSLYFYEKENKVLKKREQIIRKNSKKKRFNINYTGSDFRFAQN